VNGERITIAAAGWRAELLPAMGGSLLTLSHRGHDVLRPTISDPGSPLDSACFPLVPYANRIAWGRFAYCGVAHELPRNFGDHPHSLHGLGWQQPWRVAHHADASVRLTHRHDGGYGWPWSYRAEQVAMLNRTGCSIALSVINDANEPMPAGLGLHPDFPVDAETRLRARAERVWLTDVSMLPTVAGPADHFGDWTENMSVAGDTLIDNAYEGWNGRAEIADGDRVVRVTASSARAFHLYRPARCNFFCVEPASHLPDALNRDFPVDILAPGAILKLEMRLVVVPRHIA